MGINMFFNLHTMKKLLIKGAMICAMMAPAMDVEAQINLGNILSGVLSGSKENKSSEQSSSSNNGGLLSSLTSIFSSTKVATKDKIIGTWVYDEPAVVMESDNALKNIGGKLVTSTIESQLKTKLEKYGFKQGMVTMTFDKDGNFTQVLKGKTLKGTYTIEDKSVVLKYGGKVSQVVGTTQVDGNNLLIVMDASKLLKYVNVLGTVAQSSSLKAATSLIGSMDGLECGLKLTKK